ncbi:MAG: hypothetical protein KDA89_09410, partial [Planctomycetaceae bacterium]|nr:hypothetical protein [Planctomycetaceae bacterium]
MTTVHVRCGSRLHFGLLCAPAGDPWHYGGIGMMINEPRWEFALKPTARRSADDVIECAAAETQQRCRNILQCFRSVYSQLPSVELSVTAEPAFHSGLGCGTQLTLSLATACLLVCGLPRPADAAKELAPLFGRSRRSAVGSIGFDRGGFVVDYGAGRDEESDRPFRRLTVPEDWQMVLLTPRNARGLFGSSEESVFSEQRSLNSETVAEIASLVDERLVPSLVAADIAGFRDSLAEYGRHVGEYYAPIQGG